MQHPRTHGGETMELVTYKAAEGFFLAPLDAVARSTQASVTAAALEQRVSPFYPSQEAAERALIEKQREYDVQGTRITTKEIPSSELKVGEALEFCGETYRITALEPYNGPLSDIISHVAHVEGHGSFMLIERDSWVRVAS